MAGLPKIADYVPPTLAELSPNRVAWTLEPSRVALLIHDMQRYFVNTYEPGGRLIAAVVDRIDRIRTVCDAAGVPVFYSAQPGNQAPAERGLQTDFWGPGMSAAPEHQFIVEQLRPRPAHRVLTKWRYSAFERTTLEEDLRALGRDQLLVTGVYASIGCVLTAAQAFMRDVQPFIAADAVADFTRARHDEALNYLSARCGVVTDTATVLSALSGRTADR